MVCSLPSSRRSAPDDAEDRGEVGVVLGVFQVDRQVESGLLQMGAGAFGGAEIRSRMAKALGRDTPAAFIEDAGAIILGLIIIWALR